MSTQERTLPTADEATVELAKLHDLLRDQFVEYSVKTSEVEGRYGYEYVTTFTINSWLPQARLQAILDIASAFNSPEDAGGWFVQYGQATGFTVTFRWGPYQDAA